MIPNSGDTGLEPVINGLTISFDGLWEVGPGDVLFQHLLAMGGLVGSIAKACLNHAPYLDAQRRFTSPRRRLRPGRGPVA